MLCWISIFGGLLIMMGHHARSEALFYYFRLEDQVPENHLLRLIEKHISFEFVRQQLKDSYSETGRPSACGCDSITTWLLATSVVVAPMRLARKRSQSGCMVRSFLATMYQLGFDFHAVPPAFAANRSGAGTHWVAQTSFLSCSDKSPAKEFMPSGSSQRRPSATSTCERTSVFGNFDGCVSDASSASGANAAR